MVICGERVLGRGAAIELMPYAHHEAEPDWVFTQGTSRLLISEEGFGFLLDCGTEAVVETVEGLIKEGRIKGVEGIFVTHFQTLYSTESSVLITHDSMIREAIRFSRELKANNEWLPTTKTGSVFHTQSSHKTSVPRLDGQGREISSLPTHDAGGKPIDRREPSEHEPKTRVNPHTGRQEHWCATDWRWGNHTTEQHDEWRANLRAKRKRQKEKRDQAQQQETQQGSQASEAPPSQPSQQAITIDRNNFFRAAGGFGSGF